MILDIGCGDRKKGDIGLDIRIIKNIDIRADARLLPFRDDSFTHIFSEDVLEHFSHREIKTIINEWIRVLKRDGIFEIRCPDLRVRALLFVIHPTLMDIKNIYGEQDYEYNYHKCGFSYSILKNLLESYGINSIRRVASGYKGIPFIPDCLHIKGIKK